MSARDLEPVEIVAMGQAHAEEVAAWSYPGVYAFYDFAADAGDLAELLDPHARLGRYFSSIVPLHGLVGFVEITAASADSVEIGLGLRPEWVGRGLGHTFVSQVCDWVAQRTAARTLLLRVAAFNQRAITAYERVGFTAAGVDQSRPMAASSRSSRCNGPKLGDVSSPAGCQPRRPQCRHLGTLDLTAPLRAKSGSNLAVTRLGVYR
jgi:[ribosomal protein S18]-alanine N-acetyltransferase